VSNEQVLHPWPSQTPATSGEASDPPPAPVVVIESDFKMPKKYARARLQTANDIAHEIARVYRAAKSGELDPNVATKLVYILSTLAKVRADGELELRIEALELRSY